MAEGVIAEYDGVYQVSDHGQIRNTQTGNISSQSKLRTLGLRTGPFTLL